MGSIFVSVLIVAQAGCTSVPTQDRLPPTMPSGPCSIEYCIKHGNVAGKQNCPGAGEGDLSTLDCAVSLYSDSLAPVGDFGRASHTATKVAHLRLRLFESRLKKSSLTSAVPMLAHVLQLPFKKSMGWSFMDLVWPDIIFTTKSIVVGNQQSRFRLPPS